VSVALASSAPSFKFQLPNTLNDSFHCRFHFDDPWVVYPKRPRPPTSINVIWSLQDFHESNGATYYHPGSHLWGENRQPTQADIPKRAVMPIGSAMVFLSTLFHAGGEYPPTKDGKVGEDTGESRMGLIFLYCQPWLRVVENCGFFVAAIIWDDC